MYCNRRRLIWFWLSSRFGTDLLRGQLKLLNYFENVDRLVYRAIKCHSCNHLIYEQLEFIAAPEDHLAIWKKLGILAVYNSKSCYSAEALPLESCDDPLDTSQGNWSRLQQLWRHTMRFLDIPIWWGWGQYHWVISVILRKVGNVMLPELLVSPTEARLIIICISSVDRSSCIQAYKLEHITGTVVELYLWVYTSYFMHACWSDSSVMTRLCAPWLSSESLPKLRTTKTSLTVYINKHYRSEFRADKTLTR